MRTQLAAIIGRLENPWHRYAALVLAPTLLAGAYMGLIATDGYVSRAELMVEHDNGGAVPALDIGLISLGTESSKLDALVAETFMRSASMLKLLNESLDLRAHFQAGSVDPAQRLSSRASEEDFLEYFRDRLHTHVDQDSYIIELEFAAFDPAYAQKVTRALVRNSEDFVNNASQQLAREQLRFIQVEVDAAHDRLTAASRELVELQRKTEILSPETETLAAGQIIGGLSQELTRQRTQLRALQGFLHPDASEVKLATQRIAALQAQIVQERARLVGINQDGLNDVWLQYQDAQVGLSLATEVYKNTLASLEATRLDAARKVKYLVSVSDASLPDEAERPRAMYWTATLFLFLNLVYFVAGLILATIRDHQE